MSKLDQMRRGMERLIENDRGIGVITRSVKADNGRGTQVPTGETAKHKVICRIGYESGGVWKGKPWDGGLTIDTSPFVLARHDADIVQGDELEWRGKKFTVGVVSRPTDGGGATCTQAPLTEVK
jgi:hypothetical protein